VSIITYNYLHKQETANMPPLKRPKFLYAATPDRVPFWRRVFGGMSRTTYLEKEVQRLTAAIGLIEHEAYSLRKNLRAAEARHEWFKQLGEETNAKIEVLKRKMHNARCDLKL